MVDKSHEAAVQTTETATELAAKAEETTKQVAEKTRATVRALTDEVMGDLNQSVEQIKEKVPGFDKNQLLAYADQYKTLILEKKDQIAALSEQIKTIPFTEMMGDKAKALKE